MQLLFRLNQNLTTLFAAMADDFEPVLINPNSCGCTELQVLQAINQNIVNFGQVFEGGGGGSEVPMPANTASPGSAGEYALDGTKRADYVTGTGWLFIDGYQV